MRHEAALHGTAERTPPRTAVARGVRRAARERFHRFAVRAADTVGSPLAFVISLVLVIAWAITGPIFHFSEDWQLVINTSTTIITFLIVFLIQATQNRDARAIHLKLDELIRASHARNVFADIEDASEDELAEFQVEFARLRETERRDPFDAAKIARERMQARRAHGKRARSK